MAVIINGPVCDVGKEVLVGEFYKWEHWHVSCKSPLTSELTGKEYPAGCPTMIWADSSLMPTTPPPAEKGEPKFCGIDDLVEEV